MSDKQPASAGGKYIVKIGGKRLFVRDRRHTAREDAWGWCLKRCNWWDVEREPRAEVSYRNAKDLFDQLTIAPQ